MSTGVVARCPDCGAEVPLEHGYVSWCDCGWNLNAPAPRNAGRLGRLYERVGRRLGDRLFDELASLERLEPRLTLSKALAYGIAACVHAFVAACLLGGVALAVLAWPNPFALAAAIILVGFAFVARPRAGSVPTTGIVARSDAPTLYALVDDVARALETPIPDLIVVDHTFNATWSVVGVRRRRVLTLGLPLFTILDDSERIALIAHELAHGRNGDATRGLFVGTALNALSALWLLLTPEPDDAEGQSDLAIAELPARLLMWLVSRPVVGMLHVTHHLLLRDSQRAEYLADDLAATVAGTQAKIRLDETLMSSDAALYVVQRYAARGSDSSGLLAELRDAYASVPSRERERRRRIARLEHARLDVTHPPTSKRIELLERRLERVPTIPGDADRSRRIDGELAVLEPAVEGRVLDEARELLYA